MLSTSTASNGAVSIGTARIGSLCTGYGGLDLAVEAFFHATTQWVCDNDPGSAKILAHRFPKAHNHDDLTMTDWAHAPAIDILTAGWPCQPWSLAGKQKGFTDDRAILPNVLQAIDALRPRLVVLENVPAIRRPDAVGRAELGRATHGLAQLGYVGAWHSVRAGSAGAPHRRARTFLAAVPDTDGEGLEGWAALQRPDELPPWPNDLVSPGGVAPPSWGCAACGGIDPDCATCNLEIRVGHGWGDRGVAVAEWAARVGWWPPSATGSRGALTARFDEWLMGLPPGWVTDVPGLTHKQQIRACGNGVVPQQAYQALHALTRMLVTHPAGPSA